MHRFLKLVRPGTWVMKDASPHWAKVLMATSKGSRLSSTMSQLFQQPLAQPLAFCPPPSTPPHLHFPTPSLAFIPSLCLKQPLAGALVLHRSMSEDERYRKTHPFPKDDKENPQQPQNQWSWAFIYGVIAGLAYLLTSRTEPIPEISFPFFLQHMLHAGEVQRLAVNSSRDQVYVYLHHGALINGRQVRRYGPQFMFSISGVDSLEAKLAQAQDDLGIRASDRIPVNYSAPSDIATPSIALGIIVILVIIQLMYTFFQRTGTVGQTGKSSSSFNPFTYMSRARTTIITQPTPGGARFTDVAGMEEAKNEVMEFVDYLQHPDRYAELGARIPKGALLYGPPGTGKTLLARATASEASVPFLSIAGSDFVEMFAGVGSARVRDLFNQARRHAPCIVYIDEVDAVGRTRSSSTSSGGHNEQESTLNQLLVEMDGINPLEGVVMLASTNRVDILDQALLRPGRFDRQIAIDLPTLLERKAISEVYLRKILLEKDVNAYSSRLAALTPGHSGADIANIVNEAALHAAREKGTRVREKDFEYAIERVIAGMEKKSNVMTPAERRVVAFHEAGHALTGWLLEHTDPIMKVTIIPRTKGTLGFAQYLPSDQMLYTTEQLFDRMCMTLGGRVAEALTFKKISTVARDDLERVTEMAYKQVVQFGMSPAIGHVSFPLKRREEFGKRPYSKQLSKMIDEEVRSIVNKAYLRTEALLTEHTLKLKKLAEVLLEKEVLNYRDMVDLLGPMPFEKKFHHHQELADLW